MIVLLPPPKKTKQKQTAGARISQWELLGRKKNPAGAQIRQGELLWIPYGSIWIHMVPYSPHMSPYGSSWAHVWSEWSKPPPGSFLNPSQASGMSLSAPTSKEHTNRDLWQDFGILDSDRDRGSWIPSFQRCPQIQLWSWISSFLTNMAERNLFSGFHRAGFTRPSPSEYPRRPSPSEHPRRPSPSEFCIPHRHCLILAGQWNNCFGIFNFGRGTFQSCRRKTTNPQLKKWL